MGAFDSIGERDWFDADVQSALTDIDQIESATPGKPGYTKLVSAALRHVREFATLRERGEYTDPSVAGIADQLEAASADFLDHIARGDDDRILLSSVQVAELLIQFKPRLARFLADVS